MSRSHNSPVTRILMCMPKYFAIKYEINPWMNIKNSVDSALSALQWNQLHDLLIKFGASIEYIEPHASLPDIVFTANAGLIYKDKVVLSNFKYKERKKERPKFLQWFEEHHFQILILPAQIHFEGCGDALFVGNTLFMGYGFRSDFAACDQIQKMLDLPLVVPCKLVDPFFYHLDTCFCPLNNETALVYPLAFAPKSLQSMQSHIKTISAPSDEAHQFACNSVVIGKNIVIPAGCPLTKRLLAEQKFQVCETEMSEFLKSGGACKCLTLDLGPMR